MAMKTVDVEITPVMAKKWLATVNIDNRRIRPGQIANLRAAWERGEWQLIPDGISFGKSGRLLQGQHRLLMIADLPATAKVPMRVTTEVPEAVFTVLDQNIPRTAGDVFQMDQAYTAVARFFAMVYNGNQSRGITMDFIGHFLEWVKPDVAEIMEFCPTKATVWSSAPVRAAAIYHLKRGHDSDFVKLAYQSLVQNDVESMPSATRALFNQRLSGTLNVNNKWDLFCRAHRAFDPMRTGKVTKILLSGNAASDMLDEVRAYITHEMRKTPGVARSGTNVARSVERKAAKSAQAGVAQ